jgi:dTMP kinase
VFLARVDAYAEHEPRVAAHLLGGLAGPAVDERRRALAVRVPGAVLAGLTGQDDAASWSLRRALQPEHTRAVAATLLGLPSGNLRAEALRLALEDVAPTEVAMSLESVDGPEATAMRGRLFERAPDAVMASLARLASAEAWSLRARWLTRRHGMLADSYPVALAAALSVTGLDDDRAWSLREQAQPAAPVAALASLEGVVTPAAWQWRETYLARAPKVVMATLTGVRHAKAWPMRNAVAVDCKEALDSIMGLDEPEAWAMREMHADDWPSTTVKSLGPLAQAGRGAALISRQLKLHGGSLSLLKHAAGVALQAHRPTPGLAD